MAVAWHASPTDWAHPSVHASTAVSEEQPSPVWLLPRDDSELHPQWEVSVLLSHKSVMRRKRSRNRRRRKRGVALALEQSREKYDALLCATYIT